MSVEDASTEKRWFVGVDGSPDAKSALRWAVQFAVEQRANITPLGAWHVPLALAAMAGRRGGHVDRDGLRAEAAVAADETLAAVNSKGVVDDPLILEGHPSPLLLDRASGDAIVVVGRRGISALKHRLLGSVSQYLATHAEGPVVVVPADWDDRPCQRIVVGFDGSEHSAQALRWALDIAPADSDVVALIAIDVAPWLSIERSSEMYPGLVAAAETRITDAADAVDPHRRAQRFVVVQGPRHAFTEAFSAADTDLVVVGPRGIGGLATAMLGSVSTWLLSNAPCPVAVVPLNSTRDEH